MTCILDDDEADIEAEIQRELEALGDDSLQIEDVEDSISNSTVKTDEENALPDSLQEYLRLLQSRTEGAEEEVKECEIILKKLPSESFVTEDEALLSRRIKEQLGEQYKENPLVLREQVLAELEETELREEREKLAEENRNEEDQYALDIIRPGIIEEIQALEETAQQQLKDLEEKQAEKNQKRDEWYQERRREEETRQAREKEARIQREVQFEAAQKKLLQEQEALQTKLETEAKEEEKKLQRIEEQFQLEIKALEEERKKQNEAFIETQRKEAEYQHQKKELAATKLQKLYRGFRIRKQYQPLLEAKKLERTKRKNEELDRIERVERKLREEAEKKKLENEKRRREENEKRKREEEEKKKQVAAEKERKLKEEQEIREEEKRKREEERKRIEEEKRKQEELKRKREEEDKQREAEELQQKMEEEKRRVEEENRKREEEQRQKELEEKRKEEEERKRKEEEEKHKEQQRRRKEEEKRMKEEKERLEIEKRRAEQDRKMKEEELQKREKSKIDAEINFTQNKEIPPEQTFETSVKQDENKTGNKTIAQEQKVFGLTLTKDLEERRLQWVKEHTPWSTTSTAEDRVHPVAIKSRPRRVFSASKHLPALTEEQLLMSSAKNTPLFRVKYVALRDIPSCSMQSLSQCPDIRSLTLQNCGLLAVEGLDKCKELQELHVKDNKVEAINCKDLPKLEKISLANNNLASIHGLEGCNSIMYLDLSNNKITRIGDLTPCSKLLQLFMDNNQLINSKGLSCLKHLQHLSLSHNHLARVNEIEKCMLLQTLNLQANNLQEPPHVVNSVLLRVLKLDDNSISSLELLSRAWLPLLQTLSVSQNSIFHLAPLGNLIMLETLDISNNLISDTDNLVPGLQGCNRLRTLKVEGNPVNEDPNCRALILEALPDLQNFDDEVMYVESKVTDKSQVPFIALCQRQFQSQDALRARHEKDVSSSDDMQGRDPERVLTRLTLMSQHNQERFELAVKHLLEHENFSPDSLHRVVKEDVNTTEQTKSESHLNQNIEQRRKDGHSQDPVKERHVAATKIQALWRGWYIRHLIDVNTAKWCAAVTIQAAWKGYLVRSQLQRQPDEPWDPQRNTAATVIQAHFRGQRVRRRLNEALRAAQFYDDEGEEEFDYDEEVDLTAFDFDESALEQGWTPSETPQLPSRGPVLKLPGELSKTFLQKNSKPDYQRDVSNESTAPRPRQAWRSADSPITDVNQLPVGKATIDHDQMSMTSGVQSHASHRAEELTNEWGFRSSETAELMMRRAKKMKYNPARRKKLLDPNKRLALFKKLEESNKLREVKPPPTRRQPPNRVDYFATREAMTSHLTSTSPATEQRNREQMTYSWVYKQAVVHEDEEKNIMADRKEYSPDNRTKKTSPQKSNRSPVNLPHMDPVVLSGRTLPLISSPHFSQSLEQTSSEGPSPRRNSLSSERRVRFPAIKTHSVPNLLARSSASGEQPMKTEKSNSAGARINRDSRMNKR